MEGERVSVAEHDPRPPLFGTVGAFVAAVLAGAVAAETVFGGAIAFVGTAAVGIGLWRASQQVVTLGAGVVLVAVLFERIGETVWLVTAAGLVVLAWVLASNAIRLGRQVGRGGKTLRVELVHAVATVTVAGAGGGGSYLVFRSTAGTASLLAVGLFLASVVAVAMLLR
ncbi:hypothetical protein GRX03_14165 [Halovenus sp. WSH3]|uniref:Uncharacterized protein n=1 Tax=Halovenus carboxidivorans TaxID=2692199 RepID=A0A6B0T3V6_9EURY|nr:hypothetical protein [Halovenus carboxidivorans]MXR52745.1 hypothetical protein [Halovenus carboxidivorans]